MNTDRRDLPLHLDPRGPSWPRELDTIEAPPSELWTRGDVGWLGLPRKIAIVGSRSPTPYGIGQAERFASAFARAGVVVVSGLARGVDAAAHAAALDAGGSTIAVLGCGVDRPWPSGPLAERVARDGLLLAEFAPGTAPRRHHFPLRNRLISGLAAAVVVVEAAARSGSLITARWAADQGRDVFAIPGRVDHPMSRGAHRLLRDGATLAETPEDVLEQLGWCLEDRRDPGGTPRPASGVLDALTGETLDAGELATRTSSSVPDVLVELVRLELDGWVARAPGGLYRRVEPRAP